MRFIIMTFLLSLFSLFQLMLSFPSVPPPACHSNEQSALLQFKESFVIDRYASPVPFAYPKVDSWKLEGNGSDNGSDCCSWDGVHCDEYTGHVIGLDLNASCLYGSINSNSSLFRLVHLQYLNLAFNDFSGSEIPSALGNLSELTHLNISNSLFFGQIPSEISTLSKLSLLDLSSNYHPYSEQLLKLRSPDLRSLVHNFSNLEDLALGSVDISSPIPDTLANFSSLRLFYLPNSRLYGKFPVAIFQLPNLRFLEVAFNPKLTGQLPEFLWGGQLQILSIANTGFSGNLPVSVGNLHSLEVFDVRSCKFLGVIPFSIGNLSKLVWLNLGDNSISGKIPSALGNLSELTYLNISNSLLFGQIPSEISTLSKLSILDLSSNYNPYSEQLLKLRSPDLRSLVHNFSNLEDLVLGSVDISSPIPDTLANFSLLRELYLPNSRLHGKFPVAIFQLPNLQFLNVAFNPKLTGHLPFLIGNLSKLRWLDVSNNSFSGEIQSSIFSLNNLEILYLHNNNFSGTVKLDQFFTLKKLTELDLSENNLVVSSKTRKNGTLPNLIILGLSSCGLNDFPHFLPKQTILQWLDLSFNNLHGKIPSWIWTMSTETLEFLDLSHNFLTNTDQPPAVLPWSRLSYLDFSRNNLQGALPIPPFSTINYYITNNGLTGDIPELICEVRSLELLDFSGNKLNGTIPPCLGNFSSSLSILNLKSNNLSGAIPQTWQKGSRLKMISLGENKLQGQIPKSIAHCKMLEIIDLGNNQLTGTFPSWMGTLPELKILILRLNRFHGNIGTPDSNISFSKLQILDLSSNSFTGYLPVEYFRYFYTMQVDDKDRLAYMQVNLPTIGQWWLYDYYYSIKLTNKGIEIDYEKILQIFIAIDFSCNKLEGEIPQFIGNMRGLRLLNLSSNVLSGFIPSSIGNLSKLEALDLSQNKLSGEIPQQLVELNFLEVFNVSHNHLTGPIPQGKQFDTFQNSSFDGNSGLCGLPLSKKCGNVETLPATLPALEDDESLGLDWKFVFIGYGSGFVIGVVIGHFVTRRKHDWFLKTFRIRQRRRPMHTRRRHGN